MSVILVMKPVIRDSRYTQQISWHKCIINYVICKSNYLHFVCSQHYLHSLQSLEHHCKYELDGVIC